MMKTASASGHKTKDAVKTPVIAQSLGMVDAAVSPLDFLASKSKEEVESMLGFINDQCVGSKMIDDFEENIIGYDLNSNAIIYDGDAMVLNLAKHYLENDQEDGDDEVRSWEEYLEMAQSYIDFNIIGGLSLIPYDEEHPKPIILMYL